MTLVTIVGTGRRTSDGVHVGYDPVSYSYSPADDQEEIRRSTQTEFVQQAICEIVAPEIDHVVCLTSPTAETYTFPRLEQALQFNTSARRIAKIAVAEDLDPRKMWNWFERLFEHIQEEENVIFDVTHGYRAYSVVVSSAIDLLVTAKRITLRGVLYGNFEADRAAPPIVDLSSFFTVAQWADATQAVRDRMDARALERIKESTSHGQSFTLHQKKLQRKLREFSEAIGLVDLPRIPHIAGELSVMICDLKQKARPVERYLLQELELVVQPYAGGGEPVDRPTVEYMQLQLRLARQFLAHDAPVQAYTTMREVFSIIAANSTRDASLKNEKTRQVWENADAMLAGMFTKNHIDTSRYRGGTTEIQQTCDAVKELWRKLFDYKDFEKLKKLYNDIRVIRNGQNHGWITKRPQVTARELGTYIDQLESHVHALIEQHIVE